MCHFAMGLTHCYKTTVFLHLYITDVTQTSLEVILVNSLTYLFYLFLLVNTDIVLLINYIFCV